MLHLCMDNSEFIKPLQDERPSLYADRLGNAYSTSMSKEHKKGKGQFFTPIEIADFMAQLANPVNSEEISILDPGCGASILSCALVERLIAESKQISSIRLVLYEIDKKLIPYTLSILEYLKEWCSERNVAMRYDLRENDFILSNYKVLEQHQSISLFEESNFEKFTFIISNPPYFKLPKIDKRVKACEIITSGQPNIYALFMAIASRMVEPEGQFIFITPRSFTAGNYFTAFRSFFFDQLRIKHIHLFVSRKDTFSRDSVLQETMILMGVPTSKVNHADSTIVVSSSHGIADINSPESRSYHEHELIGKNTNQKVLHLPTSLMDEEIIMLFKSWKYKFSDLGIKISTGPVVAFRALDFIVENKSEEAEDLVPLYWLHNVVKMSVVWPIEKPKKGQHIINCEKSRSLLIPNKNYVLLRRFSAKDDKSRLIAAPFMSAQSKSELIGVENKVNYIYRVQGEFSKEEALGLAALLNSKPFDIYFRTFNGNVNVSATELRQMPMPPIEIIQSIGERLSLTNDHSEENINEIVLSFFNINCLTYD
jgi:adenine-specific DNA-methyltransferase